MAYDANPGPVAHPWYRDTSMLGRRGGAGLGCEIGGVSRESGTAILEGEDISSPRGEVLRTRLANGPGALLARLLDGLLHWTPRARGERQTRHLVKLCNVASPLEDRGPGKFLRKVPSVA